MAESESESSVLVVKEIGTAMNQLTPPNSPKGGPSQSQELLCQHYQSFRSKSDTKLILPWPAGRSRKRISSPLRMALDDTAGPAGYQDECQKPGPGSLVHEIEDKYGCDEEIPEHMIISGLGSPSKQGQFPGKRGPLGSLELMVLNNRNIYRSGPADKLLNWMSNITELDLAGNRLFCWNQVSQILRSGPHLRHCNLSQNRLAGPAPEEWLRTMSCQTEESIQLPKLSSLVLNGTAVRWDTLFALLVICNNLEELHLSLNDYSTSQSLSLLTRSISAPTGGCRWENFQKIRVLHLNNCRLNSFASLGRICERFPGLESLVAAENPISRLCFAEGREESWREIQNEMKRIFPNLIALNMNRWRIADWKCIDLLRSFPNLSELRINQIPLLEPFNDEQRRKLTVARLPDVVILNGSLVESDSRITAERFFIRYFMDADENDKPERIQKCMMRETNVFSYHELEAIHGRLVPLVEVDLSPKQTVEVVLVCEELQLRRKEKVLLNQSVAQLKKTIEQKFCPFPASKMRLFYISKDISQAYGGEELRLPKTKLHTLRVADGDEFYVQSKPEPRTRRRTSSNQECISPAAGTSKGSCCSPTKTKS